MDRSEEACGLRMRWGCLGVEVMGHVQPHEKKPVLSGYRWGFAFRSWLIGYQGDGGEGGSGFEGCYPVFIDDAWSLTRMI